RCGGAGGVDLDGGGDAGGVADVVGAGERVEVAGGAGEVLRDRGDAAADRGWAAVAAAASVADPVGGRERRRLAGEGAGGEAGAGVDVVVDRADRVVARVRVAVAAAAGGGGGVDGEGAAGGVGGVGGEGEGVGVGEGGVVGGGDGLCSGCGDGAGPVVGAARVGAGGVVAAA